MITIQLVKRCAHCRRLETELDIWLYRIHVRSYNLAANA